MYCVGLSQQPISAQQSVMFDDCCSDSASMSSQPSLPPPAVAVAAATTDAVGQLFLTSIRYTEKWPAFGARFCPITSCLIIASASSNKHISFSQLSECQNAGNRTNCFTECGCSTDVSSPSIWPHHRRVGLTSLAVHACQSELSSRFP